MVPFFYSFIVLSFTFLTSTASASDYPAVFETKLGPISTVDQYKDRVTSEYPELAHEFKEGESVHYKGSELDAMVFTTEGILSGDKHEQKLTYGEISPGLWKLIYLEAESCIRRTITNNGVSTETWICDEIWHPIAGAFADIFLVDGADLELSVLSEAIGAEVTVYSPEEPEEEVLLTLAQVEEIMLEMGASWSQEDTVWNGFGGQGPDQPAVQVTVTGQPSDRIKFNQTFLYFFRDDQMVLGLIDGEVCEFVDRVDMFICEEVSSPTQYTPFPFVLATVSTGDGTVLSPSVEDQEEAEPLVLSCGALEQSYSMLLRFHFERGSFEIYEIEGFRKALSNIVNVLDPETLLTSERDREIFNRINQPPYLFAQQVEELAAAIRLGAAGECGVLVDLTEDLFLSLQDNALRVQEFLSKVERRGSNSAAFLTDEYDLKLWSWTLEKASELEFFSTAKSSAIDIALGMLKLYIDDATRFSQNLELLMTASFFREDAYSHLIKERDFLSLTQSQNSQGPYFGLSVMKGLKGHYVLSTHPATREKYDLKPGDEIIEINGNDATALSAKDVDRYLVDTNTPLAIKVRRGNELSSKELEASYLDLVQMSYSLTPTERNEKVLRLKLNSFSIGLVDRLVQVLKPLVDQNKIEGLVVDLSQNKGGDTEEARRFLSMFIERGPLFYYKIGSRGSAIAPEALHPSPEYFISSSLPLVVVTSDQTMSAAEITASSLKDHKRALLLGGRTFGKFVGQRIFPVALSNQVQVGLTVTVAEFFSPLGKALNGLGVEPNVETLDSRPAFQDGNDHGVDMTNLEPLPSQQNFVTMLDLEKLVTEAEALISNNKVVDIALMAIDQSQKDELHSSEVASLVGDRD